MENKEPRLVKVRIFGQEYSIRATTEEKYIKEVAAYVDKKMAEIQKSVPSGLNASKIAILAAMNISDELFYARRAVSYTHLRSHETLRNLVCRRLI